jgi:hypothetical protein
MTAPPVVILLDFDGTIVGDVEWFSAEYGFIQEMKRRIMGLQVKYKSDYIINDLLRGMIRPHFVEFIKAIKEHNPNVEFFIYTASDDDWAKFIIPVIEKRLQLQFPRPIVSRSSCSWTGSIFQKSIELVRPKLYKALKRKYKLTKPEDLDNIILIDNNPRSLIERKYQVRCPTYDFQLPLNICRQIPVDLMPPKVAEQVLSEASNVMKGLTLCEDAKCSDDNIQHQFHTYIAKAYRQACKINKKEVRDEYWKRLRKRMLKYPINQYYGKMDKYATVLNRMNEKERDSRPSTTG